jgi:hypothetical protein
MNNVSQLIEPAAGGRWYAHRWPWFLMLGPAVVLVAGAFTGYLAYTREDAMVVDDYYKKGKAINQDLRRDKVASVLRLSFNARFEPVAGTLDGEIAGGGMPQTAPFRIRMAHPTQPGKDIALDVRPDSQGHFSISLPLLERARWRVVVEGNQGAWRLAGSWHWPQQRALELRADQAVP